MARLLTHPSLLPAVPAQETPRRPLMLGVHVQRIEIADLVDTDHRLVLAHARTAATQHRKPVVLELSDAPDQDH
ncbi:hypothetical protein [Streptomyces sp. NPDC058011]|uniref:hypothetical protein n=1 Tax=Streptomyces sp. NPDC058011 TaxID=3346305 RepID=UPI0036ED1E3D